MNRAAERRSRSGAAVGFGRRRLCCSAARWALGSVRTIAAAHRFSTCRRLRPQMAPHLMPGKLAAFNKLLYLVHLVI